MFEEAEFRKILAELPDDLKPFVEAAYWSRWRKRELLNLRWAQIDFMRGEMKLGREPQQERSAPCVALQRATAVARRALSAAAAHRRDREGDWPQG